MIVDRASRLAFLRLYMKGEIAQGNYGKRAVVMAAGGSGRVGLDTQEQEGHRRNSVLLIRHIEKD